MKLDRFAFIEAYEACWDEMPEHMEKLEKINNRKQEFLRKKGKSEEEIRGILERHFIKKCDRWWDDEKMKG